MGENFSLTVAIILVILTLTVYILSRKYAIGKTVGWSMTPYLDNNSYFLIKKEFVLEEDCVYIFKYKDEVLVKRLTYLNYPLCFFAGDNTGDSVDSRTFGLINADNVLGKVIKFDELWRKKDNERDSNP